MSDIETAFTFLHENTPSWIQDVAVIEEKVIRMQDELAKMPVSRSPLKKRTGSIESIRDLDLPVDEHTDPTAAPQTCIQPSRKRKTPSIHSVNAAGVPKTKLRMMVIVTYDGQIQKSFETLVRAIGIGRNMLRKAKMAAKAQEIAALAAFDDDSEATTPTVTPTEIFEVPDKALEAAQALCEKAAHQSLRDGDCRKELDGVRKHFEKVRERAAIEVAKHLAKQKEEEAAAKQEATRLAVPAPVEATPTPAVPDTKKEPMPSVPAVALGGIDIEVDDDDDEDDDFVMPPIRLTSRA